MEYNKKNFTSNFISTTRDQHQHIFRNKTQPPDVGKYNPRMESVDKKPKVTVIKQESVHSMEAKNKKLEFDFQNSSICGHIVKNITSWASSKRSSHITKKET
jgi:hypothetical protein